MAGRKGKPAGDDLLLRAKNVELAAYRAYLESVFQGVSDSLVVAGPDGTMRMVNEGTLELSGYAEDELIGRPVEMLSPEEELFKTARWEKRLRDGPIRNRTVVYWTKDGQRIPVSFSVSLMRDKAGSPIGIVGIAKDMREIFQLHEKERRLREALVVERVRSDTSEKDKQELDGLVKERTAQLENAMQDLLRSQTNLIQSEKMSAVGQLAAGVAHEINNPLGIILGFAQSMARRIEGDGPMSLPVKSIEREALRCKNLVQDLLVFSKQSKGKMEKFDLNEMVESTLSIIEAQARVKSVEVFKELGSVGPVSGDKNQLQQVIVNLCNNSIDAMPHGGKITVRTRNDAADGRRVVLEVEDDGSGIPEEIRDEIFNPFFTTKEAGKGTGLGLSLVYEIVRRHGGAIHLGSKAGRGTIFTVILPAENRASGQEDR